MNAVAPMAGFVDPILPRMSCQQLRMVVAQAAQLVAEGEGSRSARSLLAEVANSIIEAPHTSMREVVAVVARRHGLTENELLGPQRCRRVAWPRQEAFVLIYQEGRQSLPQIGAHFGKDHTTVLHGIRQHAKRLAIREAADGAH